MKTYLKFGLALAALIGIGFATGEAVKAAGGASNILPSVTGTDLVPIDSQTYASDAAISTLGTYFSANLGNVTLGTGVNQVTVTGATTGNPPVIAAGGTGSDTNTAVALAGKGTGNVLLGGTTTTLAGLQIGQPASRVNDFVLTPTATGSTPGFEAGGAGADATVGVAFGTQGTGSIAFDTDTNVQQFDILRTASAVNNVTVTGSTGSNVVPIGVEGSGTNVPVSLAGKGTGAVLVGGTTTTLAGLQVAQTASRVNDVVVTPGATGTAATITGASAGADANANLGVAGNGTGIVLLGQAICTITGASPQTCNGQRGIVTTGTLATAAATDATYTINNSSVTTSSLVQCTDQGYSGTLVTNGYPVIMTCVPGSGSIAVHITNLHSANALNGTVKIGFTVLN